MPSQDAKRASDPEPSRSRMSRRSLLQGAATVGAAGLAATAIGAVASPALAATSRTSAPVEPHGHGEAKTPAGPIMVHVRDASSGDIEVFSGTSQTRVRDKDLAARIARAIG
jgi:nitrous oxide reductase